MANCVGMPCVVVFEDSADESKMVVGPFDNYDLADRYGMNMVFSHQSYYVLTLYNRGEYNDFLTRMKEIDDRYL